MNYKTLEYEQFSHYGIIYLNIPDQKNAMSPLMLADLADFFGCLPPDNIRFIIISGKGTCFGAGGDLKSMYTMDAAGAAKVSKLAHEAFARIQHYPVPVVAVVNGYAIGGGFELALAADMIFAMPDVWFSLPELKFDMLPGGGGTVRLSKTLGNKQAMWYMLTGSKITAQNAFQSGIVQHVLETDDYLTETAQILQKIILPVQKEVIRSLKSVLITVEPYNSEAFETEATHFSQLLEKYSKQKIEKFFIYYIPVKIFLNKIISVIS